MTDGRAGSTDFDLSGLERRQGEDPPHDGGIGKPRDRARPDPAADAVDALAHELNQPLAAASNYLALARQLVGDPRASSTTGLRTALDKASTQVARAGQIVSRLRESLARAASGRAERSLHGLIHGARGLVGPSARKQGVEIAVALDAAEDAILVDPIAVAQALVDLIRDVLAEAARSRGKRLVIATSLFEGGIRTDVAVVGWSLDTPVDAASGDSRLPAPGLSSSRAVIETHGGSMWIEAGPEGGVRYCFTLPLARTEQGGNAT